MDICKGIVAKNHGYSITEHELVGLIDRYARAHGTTFAKMFQSQDDTGLALRKAVAVIKNEQFVSRTSTISKATASLTPRVTVEQNVNAPRSALRELQDLVDAQRRTDKSLSEAQAWMKVYTDPRNRALAVRERAENRPIATW